MPKRVPWSTEKVVHDLRTRIWSYVSPAARSTEKELLLAEALLQWPEKDTARMGELQFLLSDEVGAFLAAIPFLLRRLTTSSIQEEECDYERLRGPIRWSKTLTLRMTGSSQQLWITAPARRDYQTPENQMIVFLLDRIVDIGRLSGWGDDARIKGAAARTVQSRIGEAEYWLQSRMLSVVERAPLTPLSVHRVRTGRAAQRYEAAIRGYDTYSALVRDLDRQAIRAAVENAGLLTADDGILFELLCLFDTIDALEQAGWSMRPLGLVEGRIRVRGHRIDNGTKRRVDVFYQWKPSELKPSLYKAVQSGHGFKHTVELQPDMFIKWTTTQGVSSWLVVECKLRRQGVKKAARDAIQNLLAYRRAFSDLLDEQPGPYGIGMAWGASLVPAIESEIVLATPDTISAAIAGTVA